MPGKMSFKNFAQAANSRLERLMPLIAPAGVSLGFFLPEIFKHLRPFVPFLFGMMTLSGALKLRAAEFGKTIRNPVPIFVFFVSSRVLMPLCALFVSSFFFKENPDTVTGFVLLFSGPVAVSSFIWVVIFKGDKALCLTLILLDTLLAPFFMPGTVSLLMGAKVSINFYGIALSLVMMIVIPTITGVTLNETSRSKIPSLVCPFLDPLSKICLMLVIAANTSPISRVVKLSDPKVWAIAGVCAFLCCAGFLLSRLAAAAVKCDREKSAAILFSGGLRNISSVSTVAVTFFPGAVALPAILGIMIQQTVSAIMGKVLFRGTGSK